MVEIVRVMVGSKWLILLTILSISPMLQLEPMFDAIRKFAAEETGQDLVEYELLLAFVICMSAGIFLVSGAGFAAVMNTTNGNLAKGVQAAS